MGAKLRRTVLGGFFALPRLWQMSGELLEMVSASQASYRYYRYQSLSFIGCFPTKEDRDKTKMVKEFVTTGIDGGARDSLFVP